MPDLQLLSGAIAGTECVLGREKHVTHDMCLVQTTLLHPESSNASQPDGSTP
jgi:hypothetical protein